MIDGGSRALPSSTARTTWPIAQNQVALFGPPYALLVEAVESAAGLLDGGAIALVTGLVEVGRRRSLEQATNLGASAWWKTKTTPVFSVSMLHAPMTNPSCARPLPDRSPTKLRHV